MYTRFSYISYLVSSIRPSALMRLISCFSIFTLKSNAFLSHIIQRNQQTDQSLR
jgi:hypothetical protein